MRRLLSYVFCVLCVLLIVSACARKVETEDAVMITDEKDNTVEVTILAEPVDKQLDIILDEIHGSVFPGTAGSSLTAVPHCISMLNWCETTAMMDDEILYLVLTYMSELPGEEYSLFQAQMELMFHTQIELSGGDADNLLESAGVSSSVSWSSMTIQHFNSIMDAAGVDVYNYPFMN